MKILYVATVDMHIKAFHIPYLKVLHDKGNEVHVITNGTEKIPYCDKKYTISIKRSPYNFENIKAIKELKKILEEEKYDIIHCHTPMGAVVTRLAAKKTRKKYNTKVIYTAHGFHFYQGASLINWLLFYPVEKYLANYTDTLITINKEDYELAKNKFAKECKDIQYIPGVGLNIDKFNISMSEKEKVKFKKTLGLKKNDYILTCVARLDKNKNQKFLINAMKKITKKYKNIHLLLIGSDELGGHYQNIVNKNDLDSTIHFLGRREDIPQLLKITNIVVSASKREGLPVNVMEALASKIPVVALKCRGMEDLIISGKNGYIVNNQEEYISKILKIKDNDTLKNIELNKKFLLPEVEKKLKKIYKI